MSWSGRPRCTRVSRRTSVGATGGTRQVAGVAAATTGWCRHRIPADRAPADLVAQALAALAVAADARLAGWGLVPPRLELPDSVRAELAGVFGDSVDPDSVVIRLGRLPGVPHRRAFALPGVVYTGGDPGMVLGRSGGEGGAVIRPGWRPTPILVHEMVHIWQGRHHGPGYLWRSLRDQIRLGPTAYRWRGHLEAADWPEDGWSQLPVEAQAQMIGDAYAGLVRDERAVAVVRRALAVMRSVTVGDDVDDLT